MSTLRESPPSGVFFLLELIYQGGKLIAIQQRVRELHLAEAAKLSVLVLLKYHSLVGNIQQCGDQMHPYIQVL